MRYLIWVLLLVNIGCVSLKPAKNIDKAETRIKKYNKGIQNQIKSYPSLIDDAYTYIKYDTIKIPEDSMITTINILDKKKLDSIEREYYFNQIELDVASKNIIDLQQEYESNHKLVKSLNNTRKILDAYKVRVDTLFKEYVEATRKLNQLGIIDKEDFIVRYKIINGVLTLKVKTKEKNIIAESEVTTNNISIRDRFWQDWWFWGLVIAALTLLYLVGEKVTSLWRTLVDNIISFIKRLIFKL